MQTKATLEQQSNKGYKRAAELYGCARDLFQSGQKTVRDLQRQKLQQHIVFRRNSLSEHCQKNDAKASLLSGWLAWTDCAPRHLASAANDIDDSAVLKSLSYSALTCLDMEDLESLATQCRLDLEFRGCSGTKQSLQYSSWTVSLSRPGQLPLRNQDADSEATKDSQYLIFKQNGWQLKRSTTSAKKVGCTHTISNHSCASLTGQSHMHNYTHTLAQKHLIELLMWNASYVQKQQKHFS